jgi:hypothetical protein
VLRKLVYITPLREIKVKDRRNYFGNYQRRNHFVFEFVVVIRDACDDFGGGETL